MPDGHRLIEHYLTAVDMRPDGRVELVSMNGLNGAEHHHLSPRLEQSERL